MQQIAKLLELNREDYYEIHLALINCVLPEKMTPKEIEVIAAFMSLGAELGEKRHRFGTLGRKIVRERLELSHQGLSNYIKSLTEKGFLLENVENNEINFLPLLLPEDNQQLYIFKLVNKEHNEHINSPQQPQREEHIIQSP